MRRWTLAVGPLETNCYVVADDHGADCVVIDPGDEAERLLALIQTQALQVRYIFLTHGHFDHLQAAAPLQTATGAALVIHRLDAPCLTDAAQSLSPRPMAQTPPDIQAEDGTQLTAGELTFTWLHTPGHTVGCCVILCENALFSGDTLFKDDCGRCDLPGGNGKAMLASLSRLGRLDGDYELFPGHGPASTLAYERAHNPYIQKALRLQPNP